MSSALEIIQIPVLSDNYVYLLRDPVTDTVGVVDPAVAQPVLDQLEAQGWQLDFILNTHHHNDHVGGNKALKDRTGCKIVGPKADAARIPGIDLALADGDVFDFGSRQATIFDVPGHTRGHIAFWFADDLALFCGDTLFALGCGRLFEGTPEQMWHSLSKFRNLPGDTRVYCAHEYTEANARFALSVDPENQALQDRFQDILARRAKDQPTVPSRLGDETKTNPFLRADDPILAANVGRGGEDAVSVFAEVRRRKDQF